ncbi:hypothetical protein HYPSUDRAFT_69880 [Hypholoma sublateritium FD-334 SS-4]|uniref:Uncharacterized protein n=1 Tax=Hypholoma sublateritium (strain FD-334 SS-4) TaxID=945553 RepID=A0A0D2NNW6_HYPSF|nr:hypothetical protein HYPSUDRAFT_69880 [Hypholoma sublateritium FD-334 SS-4]
MSDTIDEELMQEKARLQEQRVIRAIVLRQSEIGKRLTLTNELSQALPMKAAWRTIIQLGVFSLVKLLAFGERLGCHAFPLDVCATVLIATVPSPPCTASPVNVYIPLRPGYRVLRSSERGASTSVTTQDEAGQRLRLHGPVPLLPCAADSPHLCSLRHCDRVELSRVPPSCSPECLVLFLAG